MLQQLYIKEVLYHYKCCKNGVMIEIKRFCTKVYNRYMYQRTCIYTYIHTVYPHICAYMCVFRLVYNL